MKTPGITIARHWLVIPLGALLLAGALCISPFCPRAAAGDGERTRFDGCVRPFHGEAAATATALTQEDLADTVEFEVSLKMRNYDKLLARIASGERVSETEMERDYYPSSAGYAAVMQWLKSGGFVVTQSDPRRLTVFAKGTVAQIQEHLSVEMSRVTVAGRKYCSAKTDPSLPTSVAAGVLGINGLQPHLKANKHQSGLLPQTSNKAPFLVSELLGAYSGKGLGATGSGQTIGILIDTVAAATDLARFWTANSVTRTGTVQIVNVNNVTLPAASGEETMDEEWSGGVAPGATVRVYAAGDLDFTSLDKALLRIISDVSGTSPAQPNLHQLSISLGLDEKDVGTGQMQTDSQYFAALANAGVTVFVSSGDGGSNPTSSGDTGGTTPRVEYYSSDPSVTGVGGTSLTLNAMTGSVTAETAWSDSGGGVSSYFSRPSWQTGTGVTSGTARLVPDVGLVADPNTGAYVIYSGTTYQFGGTSLGAPVWAGFCALVNEVRARTGLASVGLLNSKIYPLLGGSNFRDITSGNNGAYSATAGYDRVTGLGVPVMSALIQTLSGTGATTTPGSGSVPVVTGFSPASGPDGTSVTVSGSNFSGATAVSFNGVSASYTVGSGTQIVATVPSGATTGRIAVSNAKGTGTSSGSFTVTSGSSVAVSGTLYSTKFETTEGYNTRFTLAGQNGWLISGQGGNGIVSGYFSGQGNQAFIGNFAPPRTTGETLYRPVNYTPAAGEVITFSTQMAIVDSMGPGPRDLFSWSVCNIAGKRLFTVTFDNATNLITYVLDNGTSYSNSSGVTLVNGRIYTLVITMNFSGNAWGATLDGTPLASAQPITTTALSLTFGHVDPVWTHGVFQAGNNYMLFDNLGITRTSAASTAK